jgi:hypothetical protein
LAFGVDKGEKAEADITSKATRSDFIMVSVSESAESEEKE